jgi:hypothetical protein
MDTRAVQIDGTCIGRGPPGTEANRLRVQIQRGKFKVHLPCARCCCHNKLIANRSLTSITACLRPTNFPGQPASASGRSL